VVELDTRRSGGFRKMWLLPFAGGPGGGDTAPRLCASWRK